jgi:hypothetical protein
VADTAALTSNLNFSLATHDPNAALHLLAKIAEDHGLTYVLRPMPSAEAESDAWNKSMDFSMANDVLTCASLFLLGSSAPEHEGKGISLHLQGNLSDLEADPIRKQRFVAEVRSKLAEVHEVPASEIVIFGLTEGTITTTYAVRSGVRNVAGLAGQYRAHFGGNYVRHDLHASFAYLHIDAQSFAVSWNRDFTIPANCPQGERRGGFPYTAPAGWKRFGINVLGKFGNDDKWVGMVNRPGEWALVYHGTKRDSVASIVATPLAVGERNRYGRGIYCSPNPAIPLLDGYAARSDIPTASGVSHCHYMFVCRVNVSSVHQCGRFPCPSAEDPHYTVHRTSRPDYWFANCGNQAHQTIRTYGLLVKDVP